MIFISLSLLILGVFGVQNAIVTIPGDACNCHQISSQLDCTLANRCVWDFQSSSCGKINCGNILDQYSCSINSYCQFNGTNCIDFKSLDCSSIKINSAVGLNSCDEANVFCVNDGTSSCVQRKTKGQPCSAYNATLNCTQNGLACKWESTTSGLGSCQPIGCPNLRTEEDCLYYATNTTYLEFQLCTWQNGNCIAATTSQVAKYSYNTCFLNTLGTYTFSSNKVDDNGNFVGYCMSCFDFLLSGLIALGALIL